MHCRAHQKGDSLVVKENRRADQKASRAAAKQAEPYLATCFLCFCLNGSPDTANQRLCGYQLNQELFYPLGGSKCLINE